MFLQFSFFEFGGITKHLMTGPTGKGEFCLPQPLMLYSWSLVESNVFLVTLDLFTVSDAISIGLGVGGGEGNTAKITVNV